MGIRRLIVLTVLAVALAGLASSDTHGEEQILVLGEGLAAGMGDFSLGADLQSHAFPVLVARRLGIEFAVPRIEAPGLGDPPGLPAQPVFLPVAGQTLVLDAPGPVHNLAVPDFKVRDVLHFRPSGPRVHRDDGKRTLAHFILGAARPSDLARGSTPLEIAVARRPDLALVVLGYQEAIEAALAGDAALLPTPTTLSTGYGEILATLSRAGATVLVTTVPDPLDSAYFSNLTSASRLLRIEPALLRELYGLQPGDRISLPGLLEIGAQITARDLRAEIPSGSVLRAGDAARLSRAIVEINAHLTTLAAEHGALVFDLHGTFRSLRQEGVDAGGRRLTADYLGGVFLLNGFYPGRTGHAVIANALLRRWGDRLGITGSPYDLTEIARDDPATLARSGEGRRFRRQDLLIDKPPPAPYPSLPAPGDPPVTGFVPASTQQGCFPPEGTPACGLPPHAGGGITLPPDGQLVLDINPQASYYGDAIRAVDCPDDQPLPGFERFPPFGSCHQRLFGGLAMSDVALYGRVKITFSNPEAGKARFTIEHPEGLRGDNGILAAPQLFRLPLRHSALGQAPGLVSSGVVDLETGEVRHLEYFATIFNTALVALKSANPALPLRPLGFPSEAGTAIARFIQQPDGRLDFSLYATRFLPLGVEMGGRPVRLPLPLCSPDLQCASVAARGSSLHPNIFLTTAASPPPAHGSDPQDLPENALREYVVRATQSRFGDHFELAAPDLGGPAVGEAPLLGRLQVQFGTRFGHRLPVAVTTLAPGGMLAPTPELIRRLPAGTLPGLAGFDRTLRFPHQTYDLRRLRFTSDPWNLSLGVVDTRTGKLTSEFLHRGLVVQDLIFQLFEVEPCTPKTSFCYFGDAAFRTASDGGSAFHFEGAVRIPYPAGYRFPAPRPDESFTVREASLLRPFVELTAWHSAPSSPALISGQGEGLTAEGEEVRLDFSLPCTAEVEDAATSRVPAFELIFTKTSGGEVFHADELTWLDCAEDSTVTFTVGGTWSEEPDDRHSLSGQIQPTSDGAWAALLIDGSASATGFVHLTLTEPTTDGDEP